jgi:hypothetical protein
VLVHQTHQGRIYATADEKPHVSIDSQQSVPAKKEKKKLKTMQKSLKTLHLIVQEVN